MKRWSIPVILSFVLLLALSVYPLTRTLGGASIEITAGNIFGSGWFTGWAIVLVICQATLLIKVKAPPERPKARRRLWPAIVAGGFCFAALGIATVLSLAFGLYGDEEQPFFRVVESVDQIAPDGDWSMLVGFGSIAAFFLAQWVVWSLMLRRATGKPNGLESFVPRLTRWLVIGSVAELLVAVPCHIVTRRRDDCCAPLVTFWGMATGWAILLMCLGPALLILIQYRLDKKRPKGVEAAPRES